MFILFSSFLCSPFFSKGKIKSKKRGKMFSLSVRSNRSQMFFKIVVLKNLANFTRKHLCWSLFKKFADLNLQFLVDLASFSEEIVNGKLHFLCSVTINFCDKSIFLTANYSPKKSSW